MSTASADRDSLSSPASFDGSNPLAALIAQLDLLKEECSTENETAFISAVHQFLTFIRTYKDKKTFADFERSSLFLSYQRFFQPVVLRFTWLMEEKTFAYMIGRTLAGEQKLGDILGPHTRGAYERVSDLLQLVDFSRCESYAMMGCGKVPASLFYLHDWTSIPSLTGIERDPQALTMASQLVNSFELERIKIVEGDAANFDYGAFDVINWDPFATPRLAIMEQLAATARPDAVIILRDPFLTGTLAMESMLGLLDSRFHICAESEAYPGRFMLKHYILKKR